MSERLVAPRQFMLYLTGGALSAGIDVGSMWCLLRVHVSTLGATTVGFLGGLFVNYLFHARVTFNVAGGVSTFLRYISIVFLNYLLTIGFVHVAVTFIHNAPVDVAMIGKLAALVVIALSGYWLGKHWIFR